MFVNSDSSPKIVILWDLIRVLAPSLVTSFVELNQAVRREWDGQTHWKRTHRPAWSKPCFSL